MINYFQKLIEKRPELAVCLTDIQAAYEILVACYRQGGKVLVCGNGGSASDSEHIVGELMKGYLSRRPLPADVRQQLGEAFPETGAYLADHLQGALPAISLVSQTSLVTAFANDVAPEMVFAQQVYGYGRPGDVLIGISTSGNSQNVLYAVQVARARGLHTIGLTGAGGGALGVTCTATIAVPAEPVAEIQEGHIAIYHAICAALEAAFFPG
jgi:D-sedoheptulose 7-phosphate isomerase